MYIDNVFIVAFIIFLALFALVIYTNTRKKGMNKEIMQDLELHFEEKLEGIKEQVSGVEPIRTEEARHLCCAIRRIYPNAHVGLDYQIADNNDGNGAYISKWFATAPQPTQDQLAKALAEHLDLQAESQYRHDRQVHYPSITDQLDALYKARRGDYREIEIIDELIHKVKCRFPRPGDCERDCNEDEITPPLHELPK